MKPVGVLRGSAALVLARVVSLPLGLLTTMLLARYLGVDDYGRFTTVTAFWAILSLASEMGVSSVVIGEIAKPNAQLGTVWLAGVLAQIGFSIIAALLGLVIGAVVFADDTSMRTGIVVGSTLAFASMPAVNSLFQVKYRMTIPAIAGVGQSALALAAAYVGVRLGAPWHYFVLSAAGAGIVMTSATGAIAWRMAPLSTSIVLPLSLRIARHALPVGLAQLFAAAYYKLDAVMVFALAGPTQASYYNAAYRMYEIVLIIPTAVTAASIPYAVHQLHSDHTRYRSFTARLASALVTAGVVVSVAIILCSRLVVGVIYGRDYQYASRLLAVLMLAGVARFLGLWLGWLLTATGHRRRYLAIMMCTAVIALTADYFTVPAFGARAAAVVTALAESGVALTSAALLNGRERPGWNGVDLFTVLFGFLAVALALTSISGVALIEPLRASATIGAVVVAAVLVLFSLRRDLPVLRGSGREEGV